MVEEAGQVLEAHVLGSLVPSVEHLILIGDPLQLRPTLNNFGMSRRACASRRLTLFSSTLDGAPTRQQIVSVRHVAYGAPSDVWSAHVSDRCPKADASHDIEPDQVCISIISPDVPRKWKWTGTHCTRDCRTTSWSNLTPTFVVW